MNILLASYYNPLGNGGIEKQAIGLIKTLIKQGHKVACLTVSTPENALKIQTELDASGIFNLGIYVIHYENNYYSFKSKVLFWVTSNPAKILASQNRQLIDFFHKYIEQISSQYQIDIIHCLGLKTAYFIPDERNVPMILDLMDAMTQHKQRYVQYSLRKNITQVIFALLEFFKTKRIETNILSINANLSPVVAISPIDVKVFKSLKPSAYVKLISASTPIKPTQELNFNHEINSQTKLIFYGFLEQVWNIDALESLVYKVIPLVHKTHPNVKLLITGFNLSENIFNLSKIFNWVEVIPDVKDIQSFVASATLTCWPFHYGSGIKTKILECMALGKPIVTTNVGSEAFTDSQKKGILIADSSEGMAKHIIYLLDNPDECSKLGAINYQIALTEFTWDKRANDYIKLYNLAKEKFKNK
ncbi:MAG: glycosyltransferase family 4 protein [Nostoc sp.]|uniref:glycosyltransferase family 4 protein n=1 Tax=Nostoc sp. TaxID=1180 RepID=UPI002FF13221